MNLEEKVEIIIKSAIRIGCQVGALAAAAATAYVYGLGGVAVEAICGLWELGILPSGVEQAVRNNFFGLFGEESKKKFIREVYSAAYSGQRIEESTIREIEALAKPLISVHSVKSLILEYRFSPQAIADERAIREASDKATAEMKAAVGRSGAFVYYLQDAVQASKSRPEEALSIIARTEEQVGTAGLPEQFYNPHMAAKTASEKKVRQNGIDYRNFLKQVKKIVEREIVTRQAYQAIEVLIVEAKTVEQVALAKKNIDENRAALGPVWSAKAYRMVQYQLSLIREAGKKKQKTVGSVSMVGALAVAAGAAFFVMRRK